MAHVPNTHTGGLLMAAIKIRGSFGVGFPPVAKPAKRTPLFDICSHRVFEPVGKLENTASCGCDRNIYECPIKGRCVSLWKPVIAAHLIREAKIKGIQNCADCDSMKPLLASGPS